MKLKAEKERRKILEAKKNRTDWSGAEAKGRERERRRRRAMSGLEVTTSGGIGFIAFNRPKRGNAVVSSA